MTEHALPPAPGTSNKKEPDWDQFRDTALGRHLLGQEQAFIRQALSTLPRPPRVLELCSAAGRVMLPLREAASSLTAVDLNREALALLRSRAPGASAVAADAVRLPFEAGTFDCVVVIQCLSYFEPPRLLAECRRVLAEGGCLILQAVNRQSYKRWLKKQVRGRERVRGPGGNLSTPELLQCIADAGLVVKVVRGYNWLPLAPTTNKLNHPLIVSPLTWLETRLPLGDYPAASPWLLIAARKPAPQG